MADPGDVGTADVSARESPVSVKESPEIARTMQQLQALDAEVQQLVAELAPLVGCNRSYGLLSEIDAGAVDAAFDALRISPPNESLAVVMESPGGDIHAAYNLACLFRRYGPNRLVFIVPRWAKSAATLLACGGDEIQMTAVAELGPLDPQLTVYDGREGRHEHFSPLHIESTLALIRDEFEGGHKELAQALVRRLQFPMTLGSYRKLLEVGQNYACKLLESRMLKDRKDGPIPPGQISKHLTENYPDHGCCVNLEEVQKLGLNAIEAQDDVLEKSWKINSLLRRKDRLSDDLKRLRMMEAVKDLPPEILERLPFLVGQSEDRPARRANGKPTRASQ